MFPLGPERDPEPDIIGTSAADRPRPRWPKYVVAGGMLALAGIIAATLTSSPGHHSAAPPPNGATASPAEPAVIPTGPVAIPTGPVAIRTEVAGIPIGSAPPLPGATPTQAWAAALNIANWPMPGNESGTGTWLLSTMFAGGVAGNSGWILTVKNVARPGQRCSAAVVLYGKGVDAIAEAYPLSPHPALRTPAGDLAFVALGAQSPGVGVGILQFGAPGAQAWVDPGRVGGLDIIAPVLTERVCGQQYYLAGFAYPLAGTLDISLTANSPSTLHYLVPTSLSRPRVPGVWESTG
jgi:hypothetical protein